MRAQIIACLALLVLASFDVQATVSADELVKFDSAAYAVGKLQQRLARERGEIPTSAPATTIEGYLSQPGGSGPFPAVVYLHGCSGLFESTRKRVAELITGWGYVFLAVDSFATRGIKEACDDGLLDLSWVHTELEPFYSHTGRPSIDPVLMIRMLIVGYVFALRSERRLCAEVRGNLAYRWFCKLGIEDNTGHYCELAKAEVIEESPLRPAL